MHRSGTSALAGILHKLGCNIPATPMPASKSNTKGFFESVKVRDFNEELLASAGSSWDDITQFPEEWLDSATAAAFLNRSVELLEAEFGASQLFVLKDPRICRLVSFWSRALERFGSSMRPVLTLRNPLEVSASLLTKRNYSEPLGQMIWLRNVLDAERATRGMRRFHTSFEQVIQGWEIVAERAQEALEVVWPKPIANTEIEVAEFLGGGLRHQKESRERALTSPLLPGWLRETYEILNRWAEAGEAVEDYPKLDQVKAEFDMASRAFGRIVRAERNNTEEARKKAQESEKATSALQTKIDTIVAGADEQRALLKKALRDQQAANDTQREAFQAQIVATTVEMEQQRLVREKLLQEQKDAFDTEREALQAQIASVAAEAEGRLQRQKEASDAELEALQAQITALAFEAKQVGTLKQSLQEQRRRATLTDAELHQLNVARQDIEAQLYEARSQIAAHRARRKEAARVIADREAKIATLSRDIQTRFEELATLQRHALRFSAVWRLKQLRNSVKRIRWFRRPVV
jgi:hypothetical protein